ncbi:MAG: carboxypeptidase-like regulatory domain-containing protein [Prevotellaceae bacterium]|jgi:carbon monoxide dehydrogenase subunit G|nr:carboxypeptidase-like regulatory domain-containing protein [Prevotellaceae bacterium]
MKKYLCMTGCMLLLAMFSGCSEDEHRIFATLYGVINDAETGDPVAGATVTLSPGGKTQTSGTDGQFEFADLDAQQYTITVQKTGYQTNRKTVTAVAAEKTEANIPLSKSN